MKKNCNYLYFTLAILFLCFTSFIPTKKRLSVSISKVANSRYSPCPVGNDMLDISIRNNSKEAIKFYMMLCSYSDNFITSDSTIKLCNEICYFNIQTIITLAPSQTHTVKLGIMAPQNKAGDIKFKVGFIFQETDTKDDYVKNNYIYGKPRAIIWSNSLSIAE